MSCCQYCTDGWCCECEDWECDVNPWAPEFGYPEEDYYADPKLVIEGPFE